jgi:hypothetical protein
VILRANLITTAHFAVEVARERLTRRPSGGRVARPA